MQRGPASPHPARRGRATDLRRPSLNATRTAPDGDKWIDSLRAPELHVEAVDERERDVLHERRVDLGDVERLLQGPDAELRDLGGAPRRALAESRLAAATRMRVISRRPWCRRVHWLISTRVATARMSATRLIASRAEWDLLVRYQCEAQEPCVFSQNCRGASV